MNMKSRLSIARSIIGARDPCDVDILALTLETRVPLWSNDADFENIDEITLFKTEDILELVKFLKSINKNCAPPLSPIFHDFNGTQESLQNGLRF